MVAYEQMIEKVATQVGTDPKTLSAKADAILAQEGAGWEASGKNEEQRKTLALRVAARQLVAEKAKLTRSGATMYEGMFVNVPREKDWAKMAYNKMSKTLKSMPDMAQRLALVGQGALIIYENNHDGTYTRHANPSLLNQQDFAEGTRSDEIKEIPPRHIALDANTSFSLIWDKATTHFANGKPNFKYGSARPLEEPDRSCLFLGRKAGSNDSPSLHSFRYNGNLAKQSWPTFVTGTIGMKPANREGMAYGTKVTAFTTDAELSSIFTAPPLMVDENGASGLIADWLGETLMSSLDKCHEHYATLDDKAKWDTTYATVVEVVHIDPRENGGFIVTVADADIMSETPPIEVYVGASEETSVDFGVGSELVVVGSPWVTRDGEARFMTSGWWCMNRIAPLADTDDGEDGWD